MIMSVLYFKEETSYERLYYTEDIIFNKLYMSF